VKKKIAIILSICLLALQSFCQDLHFSQFYDMPLLRNPGLSGVFTGQFQASTIYRNQWNDVTVPYQTMALGAEYKVYGVDLESPATVSLGLQVLRDQAGASNFTRTTYAPNIAVRTRILQNLYLSTGFLAGPVTSSFNPNGLTWGDQYHNGTIEPTMQPLPLTGKNYFDFGAGTVLGQSDPDFTQWYLGFAVYHIFQPTVGFGSNDFLPRRYTVSGGLGLKMAEDERLFFYGDAVRQSNQYEYYFGGLYTFYFVDGDDPNEEGLSFGAFYRWNDALVPTVRLAYDNWIIGFSYDFNISQLAPGSQVWGGPELMVKFRGMPSSDKNIPCPRGRL